MSLYRSGTRRVPGGAAPPRQKKGYEAVQQGIKELYPEPGSLKSTDMDIVFVPGLGAHPEDSWKSAKSGFSWASDKDGVARDFPSARVLLYMYESAWTGPLKIKQFIGNLALTLLHGLHEKREASGSTRPIIFIGHSMGGLVIAKAVCIAESRRDLFPHMFEDIAGCAVFGTPFQGAEAASVAAMLSQAGQLFDQAVPSKLLDLMKPNDESLNELRHEFVRMVTKLSPNIGLCGFYEEQPTNISDLSGVPAFIRAFQIPLPKKMAEFVTKDSAILGGLMEPMGLACNHRDLVKFESFKDEKYSLVRSLLKKIVHGAHLVVKNRRQSTRNIDRVVVTMVMETLDGAQIYRKRRNIAQTTAPSSWVPEELQSLGWLVKAGDTQESSPVKRGECVWIRGPEGRGKTSAALAALEEIEQMMEANQESAPIILAYFFCESSPDYGTAEELLKSIVRQLVGKQESLASHAKFLLRKKGKDDSKGQPQLTVENLWQVLQDMLADEDLFGTKVYLVVNNLQVLSQDSTSTSTLLDLLRLEITNMNQGGRRALVRWLFTSGESYSIGRALRGDSVRLIDLEDKKYGDQVQLELRKHANRKVSDLVIQKKYSKALAYFTSSLLGRRAQNTQWIDITCVQLEELPVDEKDLQVRRLLESIPQELDALLNYTWQQVFALHGTDVAAEIKEMLRVLVLTHEDPTEAELCLLVELHSTAQDRADLRDLVEKCRPLLSFKRTSKSETRVCFIENVVQTHLLANAHRLLGLSEEDIRLQHGLLGLRSFTHIMDTLSFPVADIQTDTEGKTDDADQTLAENVPNDDESEAQHELSEDDEEVKDERDEVEEESEEEEVEEDNGNEPDSDDDNSSTTSTSWSEDSEDSDDEDSEAEEIKDKALAYAVKHWLYHASKATAEIAEALSLEKEFWEMDSVIRRRWLTEYNRLTGSFRHYERAEMSGLHVAAAVGFRELVAALIKNGHDEEKTMRDSMSFTPLHFASSFGCLDIVEELLNQGAPIDDGLEDGTMTPLHMAAAEGGIKVMTELLQRDANPNAVCGTYGAVINAAIESGNCDAVKILVEKNVSLASEEEKDDADGDVQAEEDGVDNANEASGDGDEVKDEDEDDDENDEDDNEDDDEEEEEVIRSPLALAALRSDLSMFEFLIENYSHKLPPKEFDTALVKAAEYGRTEVFKQLLTSYTHENEALQLALDEAAYEDQWDIVTLLLESCTDLKCDSAFSYVAQGSDGRQELQILEAMWEYAHASISAETLDTALYEATDFENTETVQLLLRFGANADASGEEYGNALTAAAYDGTTHIVTILLDAGANIDSPAGWALQTAAAEGHREIVDLLLNRGANVDAFTTHKNMPQGTALQAAIEAGNMDIVELLFEHSANPNLGGGDLSCPIIAAARKGEEAMLEKLLAAKADVDVFGGPDMSTPLINAAAYLPPSSISAILAVGADINLPDQDGDTALSVAALSGDAVSVQLLLDHGADILLRNKDNKNALQRALEAGDEECIEILVTHVSLILEELRLSVASGNASVAAVVRSVENRKQGLDYGEPDIPLHGTGEPNKSSSLAHTPEMSTGHVVGTHLDQTPAQAAEVARGTEAGELSESHASPPGSTGIPSEWLPHDPSSLPPPLPQQHELAAAEFSRAEPPPLIMERPALVRQGSPTLTRNEYPSPKPASTPVRRKPAPGATPGLSSNFSSVQRVSSFPGPLMGQEFSQSQLPTPPVSQHQANAPYMRTMPPHQGSSAYSPPQPHQSGTQSRYPDPFIPPFDNYNSYPPKPLSPPQQSQPQQQAQFQPYPTPPVDPGAQSNNPMGLVSRPGQGPQQPPYGPSFDGRSQPPGETRSQQDELRYSMPQDHTIRHHKSSFLGLKAPWAGDRRFN